MNDEPTRMTNEEVAEAARVLKKIEDLDVYGGDDAEEEALRGVRKKLERWLKNKSGILSLQDWQDEVFRERAEEALLDGDTEKHEKWKRLVRSTGETT